MKKLLPLAIIFLSMACKNTTTTTQTTTDSTTTVVTVIDTRHELYILDSALKQFETPMQRFKTPVNYSMKINGAKGTVIEVIGPDLTTVSGKPMGNHIDVELKELTTTAELARDRAATVSGGQLLVSGGAYYINMTSGGEPLKLKEGKVLNVKFPRQAKEAMSLFAGKRDSAGIMSWTAIINGTQHANDSVQKTTAGKNAATEDSGYLPRTEAERRNDDLADQIYNGLSLTQLGWINCDRFLNSQPLTNVQFTMDKADSLNCVSAYLLFKDINSVMHAYSVSNSGGILPNIPVGYKVKFIAIGYRNNKYYSYDAPLTITNGLQVPVKMKETAYTAIPALFNVR